MRQSFQAKGMSQVESLYDAHFYLSVFYYGPKFGTTVVFKPIFNAFDGPYAYFYISC